MHWYHSLYIIVVILTILALAFLAVYFFKRRAADEPRFARDVWKRTFDALPDLIAIIDTNYRIIRANRAMADALGVTPEELRGATCYRLMHCAEGPIESCPHRMLMEDGNPHTVELYERTLRGHYLVSVSPLYDEAGKLAGSVHVARNIYRPEDSRDRARRKRPGPSPSG